MADAEYSGLLGAFPYAFRASESRLFRSYVVIGGLIAILVGILFGFALVVLTFRTLSTGGGTVTFSRAFLVFVGLTVVFPLVAPVILVARRHRRTGSDARYDAALASAGYLFGASLYVSLLASIPPTQQQPPPAPFTPLVQFLYRLPPAAAVGPPLAAALVVIIVHRWLD